MKKTVRPLYHLTPGQSMMAGFFFLILSGTVMLMLPAASAAGVSQSFVDALFTATSAVTTTGLVVVDTGSYYSLFGQFVILLLFQLGGLGYITIVVLGFYVLGQKPTLASGLTLQESFSGLSLGDLKRFVLSVAAYTLIIEFLASALLYYLFPEGKDSCYRLFNAVFHAVSAFCTAGFSLYADSLSGFHDNFSVNIVMIFTCIAGGLGFFVLDEIRLCFKNIVTGNSVWRLNLHTKLSLFMTFILVLFGVSVMFFFDTNMSGYYVSEKVLVSFFQAVSASTTTGFNSLDLANMDKASIFAILILMFIGAAPAGSGGGIKSTTFALIILSLYSLIRRREAVNLFRRKIPEDTVRRAGMIGLLAITTVAIDVLLLCVSEGASFFELLFEVVSALGTVGLTLGITSELSIFGKFVLCATMFAGRVGPLIIVFSFFLRGRDIPFSYVEEDVYVG